MASFNQYYNGIYYYTRAALIYRELRRYLQKDFGKDLNFPDTVRKEYFYHSPFYNRTKQYMHANHFFGELMCLLRGKTIQADERKRFANLSSCAPIFDDFFEKEYNLEHIHQLLHLPDPSKTKNEEELLAVHFLNNILSSIQEKEEFIKVAEELFQAQKDSKTQTDAELTNRQLLDISIRKGGYSGLMYAHLLNDSRDCEFLEIAYDLGSFGQLMDDVFDIYDDAKEGLRTFANQCQTVAEMEQIVNAHQRKILDKVRLLSNKNYETQHFLKVFQIFASTIELAFNHYKKIEAEQHTTPFQCLNLSRKTWIIDMEKPANIWRLFHLSVQSL